MPRPRRSPTAAPAPRAWAMAAALLLALLLAAPAAAKEKLQPVNGTMARTDSQGFNWDPTPQEGVIRDGTNDCFDDAMRLRVKGGQFAVQGKPVLQTKDGLEYVFEGVIGQVGVVRRVRIDPQVAAVRYVEMLTNRSKRTVRLTVEIWSMLGGNAGGVVTDLGRANVNGPLQKGETSLFALQPSRSRPSVIFQLRDARSKMVPVVSVQNNRTFTVTYSLTIPPGKTVSLAHAVAQRRYAGQPAVKQMEQELKPMLDAAWLKGLPGTVRATIANRDASGATVEGLTKALPAHQEVLQLAKAYDVERGELAVLFLEREKPMKGFAAGMALDVATRMGTVKVPFTDVAVIRGGAGVGRSMRLFLRDGEILAGDIQAPGLLFRTEAGLEIPLDPGGVDALFLPQRERDGTVAEGTDAFLTQLDGTKLSLAKGAEVTLAAVSPWGDLTIPLEDVVRVRYAREPLPGLWALLRDGSRFPLTVRGESWKLMSRRFGGVDVAPGSIAAWSRHGVAAALAKNEDEEVVPTTTHAQLVGGCFLAGTFAETKLTLETVAGGTPIEVGAIHTLTRSDDAEGAGPAFVIKLKSGETVQGRLAEPLVRFETPRGTCLVPVLHLWAYRWSPPPGAEPPEPAEPEDKPAAKDEAPKKDAPAKGDEAPKEGVR